MNNVYQFGIDLNWEVISQLRKLDRFDATWTSVEKKEGQTLKQLKNIATVQSVASSTRIEGSKMTDEEVDTLLKEIKIEKLSQRDSQEVVGYFEVLDIIIEQNITLKISEYEIKGLHNLLLKYSEKDQWHKGKYKQHSNNVEATLLDGSKQIVFKTTNPGYETEDAMSKLIEWYAKDIETHPIIKAAIFSYEFVSIHPFQDGNGRMSRLISTLLLIQNGYQWVQYVSFENEIENKKIEYYRELRNCQSQRPNENVSSWIKFYLNALISIQQKLQTKLDTTGVQQKLQPKQKVIIAFIDAHPGTKSGEIAQRLNIPNPTIKRILKDLLNMKLIEKHGNGPGTNYSKA